MASTLPGFNQVFPATVALGVEALGDGDDATGIVDAVHPVKASIAPNATIWITVRVIGILSLWVRRVLIKIAGHEGTCRNWHTSRWGAACGFPTHCSNEPADPEG